ncbi:MAG: transcriptional regulator [Proteobacteria bacterium]|nr:transcriptional regulator [Pseudomonadota bacterium]
MKLNDFFMKHAVFTVEELDLFLSARGSGNPNTRKSLVTYYKNQGRIVSVRRGIYAVVPFGSEPSSSLVDPYLIAAKLTADAVLAYHTALEFHGKAHSVYLKHYFLSRNKSQPLSFQSNKFIRAPVPFSLRKKNMEMVGVESYSRSGVKIRVTNLERTFVDVLDKPDLAGSWEEIWRSLESIEFFDLDQVVEYVLLLNNATTAAKVGFYLEEHRESLMVGEDYLKVIRDMRPRQPHYLNRSDRRNCKWNKNWNLLIPTEIITKQWEEVL